MPVADKLIQVTETYGFDGWFINQETEGAEERALTRDDAVKMQEFIKYFKKQAPEVRLVYYDSMTSEGKMDWQNALTDKNTMFMTDEEGNAVADEMFLNFWWTEDEQAEQGKGASVKTEWPDNSVPKAGLTASQTLVGAGSTVTFASACSENTEEISWSVPGSSKETAKGESVEAVFEKEGIYEVSVTAKNESGEDTKSISVVVASGLGKDEELTLLSQGKETQATSFTNENEAPQFAVDGDITKKWCATGTAPHEIVIDLGREMAVSQVAISHAETGGEGADMNTKSYEISVSTDNTEFTPVTKVTKNTAGNTTDTFTPVNARYVKVSVVKPTQGSDSAARIYEIQVYGTEDELK